MCPSTSPPHVQERLWNVTTKARDVSISRNHHTSNARTRVAALVIFKSATSEQQVWLARQGRFYFTRTPWSKPIQQYLYGPATLVGNWKCPSAVNSRLTQICEAIFPVLPHSCASANCSLPKLEGRDSACMAPSSSICCKHSISSATLVGLFCTLIKPLAASRRSSSTPTIAARRLKGSNFSSLYLKPSSSNKPSVVDSVLCLFATLQMVGKSSKYAPQHRPACRPTAWMKLLILKKWCTLADAPKARVRMRKHEGFRFTTSHKLTTVRWYSAGFSGSCLYADFMSTQVASSPKATFLQSGCTQPFKAEPSLSTNSTAPRCLIYLTKVTSIHKMCSMAFSSIFS